MTDSPSTSKHPWRERVDQIEDRRRRAQELGGEERIARQHSERKYTIRERLDRFLDSGTFREVGGLAAEVVYDAEGNIESYTPGGYVAGTGRVDGRLVCVGGEDFTVRGGSVHGGRRTRGKVEFLQDSARHYRCPLVLLFDGAGADVRGMETSGHMYLPYQDWSKAGELLGQVPVVAAVMGPTAGGPAGRAILSHWMIMVKGSSQIFASGPPVVGRSLGEKVTKEELGGSQMHCEISGVADNEAGDEDEAFAMIREFLSYLPPNVWELPPVSKGLPPVEHDPDELLTIIPPHRTRPYRMRRVIELIVDEGSGFELKPRYGRSLITMFARIDGHVVGIIANDPMDLGGALDGDAAEKETHFIELCDVFHIPLVFLTDVPGFMVGTAAERKGTLKKGMRAVMAADQATVPQLTVFVRKAYGMGANAMGNPHRVNIRFAWPSGEWSSMPIEGGVDAAYRREIADAPDPAQRRRELEGALLRYRNPFTTAEAFALEEMIDPRDTRDILQEYLSYYREHDGTTPVGPKYAVRP